MTRFQEWVTVVPASSELGTTAAALIKAAEGETHLVRTISGGTEFLVHPLVAERFAASVAPVSEEQPKPRRSRAKKDVTQHAD